MDSSGSASLYIDGQAIIQKEARGEESAPIQLQPNTPYEVELIYMNQNPPRSYLNLSWSANGIDKQPIPSAWFAYRKQDHAAVQHAVEIEVDTFQLQEQAENLLDSVEEARLVYRGLRAKWRKEMPHRESDVHWKKWTRDSPKWRIEAWEEDALV